MSAPLVSSQRITSLASWRLILDMSSPAGHSVNDGIPEDPYSLQFVKVDDAIRALVDMAKFDVKGDGKVRRQSSLS